MALFPILEIEEKVQIGDKTRFSGIKSFTSKDEAFAIDSATITPGATGTPVDIFNAEQSEWYTDWAWSSWSFDVDSTNNKIDFEEAGVDYVATVATATYSSFSSIVTAIQAAFNAAGATGTFTVSIDEDFKLTVVSTVGFSVLCLTGVNRYNSILSHLGFENKDTDNSLTTTGEPIEYGLRKITLSIDNTPTPIDTTTPVEQSFYQKVYTEKGDALFVGDSELLAYEEDILKWVPPGRSSFKDVHRKVQQNILEWIDGQGFRNINGEKITKHDLKDFSQVRMWATYLALSLIFEGNSNAVDDVFDKKAKFYSSKAMSARNRFVAIDLDKDGKIDFDENIRLHSGSLFRR